jgi:predicted RNase H-like HicB family nuclease
MTYDFTIVIEPDDEGYHAFVPVLPGCHSHGASLDEARANIAEAIEVHVETMIEDGEEVPVERTPYFVSRLSVPIAA